MGNVHGQASIKLNTIPANTSLLGGHFVYYQGDQEGTVASANVVEKVNNNPANWGYNTHIGANGLQLRDGINAKATLTTTGLIVSQGGIEAGTRASTGQPSNDGYIYVSSEDGPRLSINNFIPAEKTLEHPDIPQWREIVGSKFGVLSDGSLYASNVNVSGAITATSLTIGGSDGSTYSGIAAMNISGYEIIIVNDDTSTQSGGTNLYPHMYHNGVNIDDNKVLSEDNEVDINKDYFEKVGNSYIKIDSPAGSPKAQNYYEKEIIPYHYIWFRDNQTDGGINGDKVDGHIFAEYGHTYRVTYSFDDGAVNEGTSVQYVEVDPSKYITRITEKGIQVHPENWSEKNYLQIQDSLEIFKNNVSVAEYKDTIRLGLATSYHLEITSDKISFVNGDDPSIPAMAYISNEQLYIPRAVIVDNLQVGDPDPLSRGAAWKWFLDDDNNMGLYYIGTIESDESEN